MHWQPSGEEMKDESGTEVDNFIDANFISTMETWRIGAPRTSVEPSGGFNYLLKRVIR